MTIYANVGHILLKRGNTTQSTAYTGPVGEVTYDTDLKTIRVHDGSTAGGNAILINQTTLTSYQTYANANAATQANSISTLQGQVYANANVASYMPVYSGNITVANISFAGNTGSPANISTVRAWARVTIGTTAYWTPLYQ
jgi:hypothetical protein